MAPDTATAPFAKLIAPGLNSARCLLHPLREAAARCPHCGGTFCRECVTDEEGKLACPPCLRRMARPPAPRQSIARRVRQALAGLIAFAALVALLFFVLRWRVNTPEEHLNLVRTAAERLPDKALPEQKVGTDQ